MLNNFKLLSVSLFHGPDNQAKDTAETEPKSTEKQTANKTPDFNFEENRQNLYKLAENTIVNLRQSPDKENWKIAKSLEASLKLTQNLDSTNKEALAAAALNDKLFIILKRSQPTDMILPTEEIVNIPGKYKSLDKTYPSSAQAKASNDSNEFYDRLESSTATKNPKKHLAPSKVAPKFDPIHELPKISTKVNFPGQGEAQRVSFKDSQSTPDLSSKETLVDSKKVPTDIKKQELEDRNNNRAEHSRRPAKDYVDGNGNTYRAVYNLNNVNSQSNSGPQWYRLKQSKKSGNN